MIKDLSENCLSMLARISVLIASFKFRRLSYPFNDFYRKKLFSKVL